jgi:hypothetical protein
MKPVMAKDVGEREETRMENRKGEVKEGDQPVATVTIEPTNQDEDGTEVAPVYTPAP